MPRSRRAEAGLFGQRLLRIGTVIAPVVLATAAMLAAFVLAANVAEGALRDALLGAIIGGFVTLIVTLAAQQLQANAERNRRTEERGQEEIRVAGAIARELAECGAYLRAMVEGPSAGQLMLLPERAWLAYGVELGSFWHPWKVADLALVYNQITSVNEVLVKLGAPADGSTAEDAVAIAPELVAYLNRTKTQTDAAVALLNRRGDMLARRFGWPETPREDDY